MREFFLLHQVFCILLGMWAFCSLLTWGLYVWDKQKSIKSIQRISEKTLISWSLVGSLGALVGIYYHRHKSSHFYFPIIAWQALVLQGVLLYEVY